MLVVLPCFDLCTVGLTISMYIPYRRAQSRDVRMSSEALLLADTSKSASLHDRML